jgi:serine/threonine-protein kinase
MTTVEAIVPGTRVDNCYQIEKILGQGGFGRTYLALNTKRFNEPCVLKEFVPQAADTLVLEKCRELFQREAETLYKLNHPQIPRFLAWFEENNRLFIVQEYVDGQSYYHLLRDRLKQARTFSEAEILQWLQAMLPVLHYIHSQDIVHRDIAPDNVMLPKNQSLPVLIDFGVVKQAVEGSLANSSRIMGSLTVGKLGYAPPEQIRTAYCSPSGDLYSLAATAVVLLTGRQPDQLFDSQELEWQWRSYARVSNGFAIVLNQMLSDKPKNRYPSAAAVLEALSELTNEPESQTTNLQVNPTVVEDLPSATVSQKSQASNIPNNAHAPQKLADPSPSALPPKLKTTLDPFLQLAQDQFTGKLLVRSSQQSWSFFYCIGRIAWATSSSLPNRRFLRLLQTYYGTQVGNLDIPDNKLPDPLHYHLLVALARRQPLNVTKNITPLVRAKLGEVLFDLLQLADRESPTYTVAANAGIAKSSTLMSAIIRPENAVALAAETWIQWQNSGLAPYSPDLALVIRQPEQLRQQVTESTYHNLTRMADGQRTLREIAALLKQNIRQLTLSLLPYLQSGILSLQRVPDTTLSLISPKSPEPTTLAPTLASTTRSLTVNPLIVCIDDSLQTQDIMKALLETYGYRFVGIQDPLRAIPTLLSQKPGLVFLDLVMPVANGYEICSQIRRVSALKNTPVIILTGNDGVVDRIRANLVGATDFLSKPIDDKKLLKVLQQHCPLPSTADKPT